ncbi:MAG: GNAT family N-acetyltransferase, partial [Anaerolineales bacterium]|nr:GNAT family N-acetyltransferase [Anaerolineales bacterium]
MKEITYPVLTKRLKLRPLTMSDLDDVYEYHRQPEVVRYMYWEPKTRLETKAKLEQNMTHMQFTGEGSSLVLAVELPEPETVIGEMTLFWRSEKHQQGELGCVFNPVYHGRGYATEAAAAILSLGFDYLDLHRIYGRCDARNVGSYKLMERLGMRRKAHF